MKKYLAYLNYILRHKWYVFKHCLRWGYPLRGIFHDLSKLRPSEFIAYANHFHGDKHLRRYEVNTGVGYYKPVVTGDPEFDDAWFYHTRRNPHHWQYWCYPVSPYEMKVVPMPIKYIVEMVADWAGAGEAQGYKSPKNDKYENARNWYNLHKGTIVLHERTRFFVEFLLGLHSKKPYFLGLSNKKSIETEVEKYNKLKG